MGALGVDAMKAPVSYQPGCANIVHARRALTMKHAAAAALLKSLQKL